MHVLLPYYFSLIRSREQPFTLLIIINVSSVDDKTLFHWSLCQLRRSSKILRHEPNTVEVLSTSNINDVPVSLQFLALPHRILNFINVESCNNCVNKDRGRRPELAATSFATKKFQVTGCLSVTLLYVYIYICYEEYSKHASEPRQFTLIFMPHHNLGFLRIPAARIARSGGNGMVRIRTANP